MFIRPFLRTVLIVLSFFSAFLTLYLYLYPLFQGCNFHEPSSPGSAAFNIIQSYLQPTESHDQLKFSPSLRLLVLADPQLEGDSSLPASEDSFLAHVYQRWNTVIRPADTTAEWLMTVREELRKWAVEDLPDAFQAARKRIDLFGNDYYLAHIYRTIHWWTNPSHVAVLGDLIGSQWVTDEEFERRGWRYWNRVFRGSSMATLNLTKDEVRDGVANQTELYNNSWSRRLINVAGNHDIGYAGDISAKRISRFERVFGPPNWDLRFEYPKQSSPGNTSAKPTLHLIVLNSLNLDMPALSSELQTKDYDYLNQVISSRSRPVEDRASFTLLLTHLPLYKPEGVCVDPPHFQFYDFDDSEGRFKSGGLREQNHLSQHVSTQGILQGLFGMSGDENAPAHGRGRNGLILTGHDHEGCDTWHHVPSSSARERRQISPSTTTKEGWLSIPWSQKGPDVPETGIREITLRSMMGAYSGNAGLLTVWYDFNEGEWDYRVMMCSLGTQHIWWGVNILDIITLFVLLLWGLYAVKLDTAPTKDRSESVQKLKT